MSAPPDSPDALLPEVYDHLRGLAARYLASNPATLDPTGLVHEAWERLARRERFESRGHFAAVAARAMRQILIDRARARNRLKRGQNPVRTTLSGLGANALNLDVVDLARALEQLEAVDPRGARVVELRWFGGLTEAETAEVLGLSQRSVQDSWRLSRAWLLVRLR